MVIGIKWWEILCKYLFFVDMIFWLGYNWIEGLREKKYKNRSK